MAAMAISMGENDESAVVLDTWTYRASTSENTLMGSKMWKKMGLLIQITRRQG